MYLVDTYCRVLKQSYETCQRDVFAVRLEEEN